MSEHFASAGADANQIRGCELSILRHFSKKLSKVMILFRTCLHGICTEIRVDKKHSSFSFDNVPSLKKSSVIRTYADLRIHSFMEVFLNVLLWLVLKNYFGNQSFQHGIASNT